ncbi:autotransporter outer membrane beta-barrel domain-containing protein [Salmonella enterica]|nr:autotransporter outer membrane beta-barrel domain-containing protein [Salmonella enterica]
MVDLSKNTLLSGDAITIPLSSGASQGIFGNGYSVDIGDSGFITLELETTTANARGLNLANSDGNNLGQGSVISVKSQSASGGAIGANLLNVDLMASGLEIEVDSATSAIGINSRESTINLGAGSKIRASGTSAASGINIKSGTLQADHLQIESRAKNPIGIAVSEQNTSVDLGSRTSIVVNNSEYAGNLSGAGIQFSGENNRLNVDELSIQATGKNVVGISIGKSDAESRIDLGNASDITTSGEKGTGIYFDEGAQSTLTASGLYLTTSGINSNGIEAHGGTISLDNHSVVHSLLGGGIQAITNEDSDNHAKIFLDNSEVLAKTVGVQATGKNSAVILNSSRVTATDGAALQASDGGKISVTDGFLSGSKGIETISSGIIEFKGTTKILSESGTALKSSGSGSNISGSGQAFITGNIVAENEGKVNLNLNQGSVLDGSIITAGEAQTDIILSDKSLWVSAGSSDVTSLELDNSTLMISGTNRDHVAGSKVTISGNYKGNNGLIVFNSVLGGDDSTTDKLVVEGDSSGSTLVSINNLGGRGAETETGIELIQVNGLSEGIFEKKGRIVAGAYEYEIVRGEGNNYSNWYLSNRQSNPEPEPEPIPEPEPEPIPEPEPGPNPESQQLVFRPEGGAYVSNQAAAQLLFEHRITDRQGRIYTDILTGEQKYSSLWMHTTAGHTRNGDTLGQLHTTTNRVATLIGGDLINETGENGKWRLGLLGGYGNSSSNTISKITHYRASGETRGYTAGIYGSWYAEGTDTNGLWLDGVLRYSWFNNTVSGEEIESERYNTRGLTASLETGFVYPVLQSARSTLFIQPQAQVAWSGISDVNHSEKNGSKVKGSSKNNLRSRLGIKVFAEGHSALDDHTGRNFRPFIETNWIHNTRGYAVTMDGISVSQAGNRNIAELKTGVEGEFKSGLSISGNIGQQVGGKGWSDTTASIGIRYSF